MSGEIEVVEGIPEVLPDVRAPQAVNLFHADSPGEIVAKATEMAQVLADVLRQQKLTTNISGREHVRVEGWTFCGTMLGVFPVCVWTRPLEGGNGWEARVEARTMDGSVVGAAEAECTRDEKEWGPNPSRGKPKDDYALRSMAQTRATSKALRLPLGFIVALAGFEVTPEEEMPGSAAAAPAETAPEFDPAVHRHPRAIVLDGEFFNRFPEQLHAVDPSVDWKLVLDMLGREDADKLGGDPKIRFWTRASNAVAKIEDLESFPPTEDAQIVEAFAWAFEGIALPVPLPRREDPDGEVSPEIPLPTDADDVEF